MCAMMPMLRTLFRSVSTSRATAVFPCLEEAWGPAWLGSAAGRRSPTVVGERLVRFGHFVGVLAALHAGPEAVARIEQLVLQAFDHGLLAARLREGDEPAQRKGRRAARLDLDRHLVGGTTDAPALHLDARLDVVQRALERDDRVG